MKSLDNLNHETIQLLKNNKLLLPLIKSEFVKNVLEKVDIEKEEEEKLIKIFLEKYGVKDMENKDQWMNDNNLNSETLKNLALADVKLKKYCDDNFKHKVNARFLEGKNQLDIFVYTLIRVDDMNKAKEIYMQLLEKEADIGDLATKYSQGPEKNRRGIVGPISIENTHPILAKELKFSQVGIVQPPIKLEEKFNIVFRVEYSQPAQLDQLMQEKLVLELFDEWVETNVKKISEKLINSSSNKITN